MPPQINMSIESKEFKQAARKESLKSIHQQPPKAVTTRQSRQRRNWEENWTLKSNRKNNFDIESLGTESLCSIGVAQSTRNKKETKK